jgi:hypothetical protein
VGNAAQNEAACCQSEPELWGGVEDEERDDKIATNVAPKILVRLLY